MSIIDSRDRGSHLCGSTHFSGDTHNYLYPWSGRKKGLSGTYTTQWKR